MRGLAAKLYALRVRIWTSVRVPAPTRIAIYCGDCMGNDALLPTKTYLSISGTCGHCGGRSYELASKLGPIIAARSRAERVAADQEVFTDAAIRVDAAALRRERL